MKKLLSLLVILSSGCQANPSLVDQLNVKVMEAKDNIVRECEQKATNVQKITIRRDSGVSKERALDVIFIYADQENKEPRADPPLTTAQILFIMILTDMVYNKPHITTHKLYDMFYKECIETNYADVDRMYKKFRYQIEYIKSLNK